MTLAPRSFQTTAVTVGLCAATTVEAYVGPGAGISVIGALIGLVSAIFLALFAVLRWPIKRYLARRRAAQAAAAGAPATSQGQHASNSPNSKSDVRGH